MRSSIVALLAVALGAAPAVAETLRDLKPISTARAQDLLVAQGEPPRLPEKTPSGPPLEGFVRSRLDQPVFAPFRREGTLREATRPTYVITRQQIQRQGILTVQEALRYLPGVLSDGIAGPQLGAQSSQYMRGGDSAQTLILLDGRPINDFGRFGEVDLSQFTTDTVERVEVVPGGGSTLYGSDAVGGIINIVTRAPQQTPTATVRLQAGSFGFNSQSLQTSGTSGALGWRVGYDRTASTSNFPFTIDTLGLAGVRENSDVLYNNFNAHLAANLDSRTRLSFNLLANNKEFGVASSLRFPTPDFRQFTNDWHLDLVARSKLGAGEDSQLTARLWTDLRNYRADVPVSFGTRDEIASNTYGLQLQHNWRVTPDQTLTYGFDLRTTTARNTTFFYSDPAAGAVLNYAGETTQSALFAQDEIALGDTLKLQLGLRQDFNSLANGSVTSPAVGARWEVFDSTTLRAGYTRSFRAPLIVNQIGLTSFGVVGNPNLRPERGDNYEVGLDQAIGEDALLRFTYFSNTIADAIAFIFGDFATGAPSTYTNIGLVRTTGIEAALDAQIAPYLFTSVNFTGNEPRILQNADPATVGKELAVRGADSFNASLSYEPPGGWLAGIYLHSIGRFFVNNANTEALPGYTTVDLKLRAP
jgi:vitamin B12 transporter